MNCPYYTAIVQYFSMGNHTNQHFSFLSAAAHHNRDIYIQRSTRCRKKQRASIIFPPAPVPDSVYENDSAAKRTKQKRP